MKRISQIVLILIGIGLIYLFVKGHLYRKEIAENRRETICKFSFCKEFPKTTEAFFKYYVNDKLYRNSYGRCPENYNEKLNGFYVIYYSAKDPNKIEVDFTQQITDTVKIKNAGFEIKM